MASRSSRTSRVRRNNERLERLVPAARRVHVFAAELKNGSSALGPRLLMSCATSTQPAGTLFRLHRPVTCNCNNGGGNSNSCPAPALTHCRLFTAVPATVAKVPPALILSCPVARQGENDSCVVGDWDSPPRASHRGSRGPIAHCAAAGIGARSPRQPEEDVAGSAAAVCSRLQRVHVAYCQRHARHDASWNDSVGSLRRGVDVSECVTASIAGLWLSYMYVRASL